MSLVLIACRIDATSIVGMQTNTLRIFLSIYPLCMHCRKNRIMTSFLHRTFSRDFVYDDLMTQTPTYNPMHRNLNPISNVPSHVSASNISVQGSADERDHELPHNVANSRYVLHPTRLPTSA
jgi:hypothetical protein